MDEVTAALDGVSGSDSPTHENIVPLLARISPTAARGNCGDRAEKSA